MFGAEKHVISGSCETRSEAVEINSHGKVAFSYTGSDRHGDPIGSWSGKEPLQVYQIKCFSMGSFVVHHGNIHCSPDWFSQLAYTDFLGACGIYFDSHIISLGFLKTIYGEITRQVGFANKQVSIYRFLDGDLLVSDQLIYDALSLSLSDFSV